MDHNSHLHHLQMAFAGIDPLAVAGFFAIFSFSFIASLHCAVMCAPLVCALLGRGGGVSPSSVLLYNVGRLISYVAAGAVLGAFGGALLGLSSAFGFVLAAFIAIFLFVAAFRVFQNSAPGVRGGAVTKKLLEPMLRLTKKLPPPAAALGLGLITVVFPCMTLAPVLALASASGSALRGAALLAAFQGGTLAVMVIAPLVPNRLVQAAGPTQARKIAVVFLLVAGAASVFRLLH